METGSVVPNMEIKNSEKPKSKAEPQPPSDTLNALDAPDPFHKYRKVKWNPLIVDEERLENVAAKAAEDLVEKKLKKIFQTQLEECMFRLSDDFLNKWVEKILEVGGSKIFSFVLQENMAFWTDVEAKVEELGGEYNPFIDPDVNNNDDDDDVDSGMEEGEIKEE